MDPVAIVLLSFLLSPLWLLFEMGMAAPARAVATAFRARDGKADAAAIEKRFQGWFGSSFSHLLQFFAWMVYARTESDWVFDVWNWPQHLIPRVEDLAGQQKISPYYLFYFTYCFYSLFKDLKRNWGNLKSPMNLTFLIHHLLAVAMISLSIAYGVWRAGALTRMIHDVGDVVLNVSKMYRAWYEIGQGSYLTMTLVYLANVVSWFGTRIGLYGYLCWALTVMYRAHQHTWVGMLWWVATSTLVMSWLMEVLQVIWGSYLLQHFVKFVLAGGVHKGSDATDETRIGAKGRLGAKQD